MQSFYYSCKDIAFSLTPDRKTRKDYLHMKTAIIYYSYTGKTKAISEKKARKEKADLIEMKDLKHRSVFSAYVFGSLASMMKKKAKVQPISCDLSTYDRIIIAVPLWAGSPASPFHNIVKMLPAGKPVEVIITSGSGDSSGCKEKVKECIAAQGARMTKYLDVKTS